MRNNYIVIIVLALLLAGAGWLFFSSNEDSANNMYSGDNATGPSDQSRADADMPPQKLADQYRNKAAVVTTGQGSFTISFFDDDAPKTIENFIRLAQAGKYDNVPFHRIIKGFMIQTGDYENGNGTGGQSAFGQEFADELYADTESYKRGYQRGIVAMANAGPNTNGSQFFIMQADYPLPHNYTIFAEVIDGMATIDKIASVTVLENLYGEASVPAEKIVIEKIIIKEK